MEQSTPPRRLESSQLQVTLVNHSTSLIQQASNILTDPIWSERTSPLSWIGPKRRRKPGVRIDDLPDIDTVLLSHNHYDNLDLPTLRELAARGRPTFVVAGRGARLLRSEKIEPVHELDWGESLTTSVINIHCVPALHFSARGIFDRNKTLWCGYAIELRNDSCISRATPASEVILRRFGKSLARHSSHYYRSEHMSRAGLCRRCTWLPKKPFEATKIPDARTSIAIHHGTFQLADDGIDTPEKQLVACSRDDSFLILKNDQFANIA